MVILRGREYEYRDQAIDLLRQFQNDLGEVLFTFSPNSNMMKQNLFLFVLGLYYSNFWR
jgi:translation initiation factor IF-3